MNKLDKILSKAKVGIMFNHNSYFLQEIMYSMKWEYDKSIPTAGTNGLEIQLNTDWFSKLSEKERIGLLAHELWHVAFEHMLRGKDKDKQVYNQAADHVINLILLDTGYSLPPNGLHDPDYKGMSTEEVYKDLMANPDKQMPQQQFAGQMDLKEPEGNDPAAAKQIQEQVTQILVKARTSSKLANPSAGNLPGGLDIMLDELINPQLPWNVILQNYLTAKVKEELTFSRPNRRYMPDMYMPTLTGEGLSHVMICMDSSGSVTNNELNFDWAEIRAIKERLNPVKLTIINFDHGIRNTYEFTRDQEITGIKFKGRGGTSLTEPINKIKELNPDVAVIFSDLECTPSPKSDKPKCDLIWVCIGNPDARVNFGKLIHARI